MYIFWFLSEPSNPIAKAQSLSDINESDEIVAIPREGEGKGKDSISILNIK